MCCFFVILLFLGPRVADIIWWLLRPAYVQTIFRGWPVTFWLWPVLGIIFIPWTTLMYFIVAPGGVVGFDWVWLGLSLAADIFSYGSGYRQRGSVPGMS